MPLIPIFTPTEEEEFVRIKPAFTRTDKFVRVMMTPERQRRADILANKIPTDINDSATEGEGIWAGCVSEVCLTDYLRWKGHRVESNEDKVEFSFDISLFILGNADNMRKLENKSTRRTSPSRFDYNVHISKKQIDRQKVCDFFTFTSLRYEGKVKNGRSRNGSILYEYYNPLWVEIVGKCKPSEVISKFDYREAGDFNGRKGRFIDDKPATYNEYFAPIDIISPIGESIVIE